jgi:arylsulfatase A-like enzyme
LKQRNYHVLVKGVFELTAHREFEPKDYAIDTWLRRATPAEIRASKTIPHIPLEERFQQLEQHLQHAKRTLQPVFVWMHFLRPHRSRGSFVASEEYDFGDSWLGSYDSAVAATDRWLSKIEALMTRYLGSERPTVWVVQSDHAAGLWQGKSEKGKNLLDDYVHVPLIIAGPGVVPGTVRVPVDSAVDTAATLLDLAGLRPPAEYDGATLVPLLLHRSTQQKLAQRAIYLEQARWRGALWKQYKLVVYRNAVSLFDVETDPRERHNIAGEHPEVVDALRPAIDARSFEVKSRFRGR